MGRRVGLIIFVNISMQFNLGLNKPISLFRFFFKARILFFGSFRKQVAKDKYTGNVDEK